jgi:hypothetical protein
MSQNFQLNYKKRLKGYSKDCFSGQTEEIGLVEAQKKAKSKQKKKKGSCFS